MIQFNNLTMRNFFSVGNSTQALDLNCENMTLVLGKNMDVNGGDSGSRNGSGKAQPMYSRIKTPEGWKLMGDMFVGDIISTPDGGTARVNGVFPQGEVKTYEITFADGRKVQCCEDHLWKVRSWSLGDVVKIISTREIIMDMAKWDDSSHTGSFHHDLYIPLIEICDTINIPNVNLPDPYEQGVSLGNGFDISLEPFNEAHPIQKLNLIRGVLDTIGQLEMDGDILVKLPNDKLFDEFQYIIRSIGAQASLLEDNTIRIQYKKPREFVWKHKDRDNLPVEILHLDHRELKIESIRYVGMVVSQCISIDHPDHLYITDDFVVTHNTTICNAISYALYGKAISNIKRDNLINKINQKNMLVTLEFKKNDITYRIERGRKPAILRFFINGVESESDQNMAQGENKQTQDQINSTIGMSHLMFTHTVILNTYSQPFLSLKPPEQREVIEELLGITLLSEKADCLKETVRETKLEIVKEEYSIKGKQEANELVENNIKSLTTQQKLWNSQRENSLKELQDNIEYLEKIDIEDELEIHRTIESNKQIKSQLDALKKEKSRNEGILTKLDKKLKTYEANLNKAKHQRICFFCKQELVEDATHKEMVENIEGQIQETINEIDKENVLILEINEKIESLTQEYSETTKKPVYNTIEDAYNHSSSLNFLILDLQNKTNEVNPYNQQIEDLRTSVIQEINYDKLNNLNDLKEHQSFLLKLLVNKDSFIRKKIIAQNLKFLNQRLTHYLDKTGLPHTVIFKDDLDVEITEIGKDLDFDNLSRGEGNRLTLSLSWAFRDVWEQLYDSMNILMVDELFDSGIDTCGLENCVAVLKGFTRDRNKSVFLISHRDELVGRVNDVLMVKKENGYTQFGVDCD